MLWPGFSNCAQNLAQLRLPLAAFIVSRHDTHRPSNLALRVRNWIGDYDVPADGDCEWDGRRCQGWREPLLIHKRCAGEGDTLQSIK